MELREVMLKKPLHAGPLGGYERIARARVVGSVIVLPNGIVIPLCDVKWGQVAEEQDAEKRRAR